VQLTEEGHGTDAIGPAAEGPPVGDMPLATALAAIDRLVSSPKPRLGLQLFGGEPTRRWDRAMAAVHALRTHPRRNGREVEIQLTTNGLGFDRARLAELRAHDVTVQLSVDGPGPSNRFRRPHLLAQEQADGRWAAAQDFLNESGARWFLNVTIPPAAAGEVRVRYREARAMGVSGLQLNYATGMRWKPAQVEAYLSGLAEVLYEDRAQPGPMALYNWHNAADPAPLCGDVICDVDGTLLQVGGIFHERRFPTLYTAYVRGHVRTPGPFSSSRSSLAELWERTLGALTAEEAAVFRQGMNLGAAQDLVCRTVRRELGIDR
jgi:hypothetical protein